MDFSNENPVWNRLALVATIALAIAYGWLSSVALEPTFPVPSRSISGLVWIEKGVVKNWREVKAHRFLEVGRIASALNRAEAVLRGLPAMPRPIALVIDTDRPRRYSLEDAQLRLGSELVTDPGVLERAIVKAWLLQTADVSITHSLFRLDVAADVLVQLASGDAVEAPRGWLASVASFSSECAAAWRSLELSEAIGRECRRSDRISPFSFRPLIASTIASAVEKLPGRRRLQFVELWAQALNQPTKQKDEARRETLLPASLAGWKNWIREETTAVLALDRLAKIDFATSEALADAIDEIESESGLLEATPIEVEAAFRRDQAGSAIEVKREAVAIRSYLVLQDSESAILLPGRARIPVSDLEGLSTRVLVWESCESPKIGDIVSYPVASERVLFVKQCGRESGRGWSALMRGGVTQFAKEQPGTPFLLLRRSLIDLAVKRGQMRLEAPVSAYMEKSEDATKGDWLGLGVAEWRRDLRAYRVLGAIEAIEWFRGI